MGRFSEISRLNQWFSSRPEIVWIHVGADLVAFLAYAFILAALISFVRNRHDLTARRSFLFFGIFLFLAAALHLFALFAPWYRIYSLQAVVKLVAAILAFYAGFLLWRYLPKTLQLPGPSQLKELEDLLETHKKAEEKLEKAYDGLVSSAIEKERTLVELRKAVEKETAERKRLETICREAEGALRFLPGLFQAIDEATDFHSVLETALREICEAMDWQYGEAWVPRPDGKVLELNSLWYRTERLKEFGDISREIKFPPNMEIPGRVWASKKNLWISDLSTEASPNFFRAQKAREAGIRAALGVPVVSEGKVMAVLAYFLLLSFS